MKNIFLTCSSVLLILFCSNVSNAKTHPFDDAPLRSVIPLGGNAWVNSPAKIKDSGLTNWADPKSVGSIYFRVSVVQDIKLSLRLKVPGGESVIKVSSGNSVFTKKINNMAFDTLAVGKIHITHAGYVKIDLQGISKTGD